MSGLIAVIFIFMVVTVVFLAAGFFVWRRILHFAKSIERGLKMVPVMIHLPPPSGDIESASRDEREVIQEQVSQAEVLYNLIAGTFKKGWKSKFYGQRHMALEIIATGGLIKFFTAVPVALLPVIKQAILTAYPEANLEEVEDHNIFSTKGKLSGTIGGELELKKEYSYPIATFTQLKRDAIQALINGMMTLGEGEGAAVQILLRPAFSGWTKAAETTAKDKRDKKDKSPIFSMKELVQAPFKAPEQNGQEKPDKPLSNLEQSVVDAIEEKTKHPGFEVMIRLVASANTATQAQSIFHNLTTAFSLFDAPGLNGFSAKQGKDMESFITSFIFRFFPPNKNSMILNSVELATLFHLPDAQFTHSTQVERQYSKQVEAPSKLPSEGILLGYNNYRGTKKDVRLADEDRRRHAYIVGQTGTGKSTLLKQLVYQDMLAGRGLAFIDPHGDAAEELLSLVPKTRTEDVIYFSPGETEYPMGLNLFEFRTQDEKDFLIQEAISMLYKLYDPQHTGIIGPIYEHWFRNCALAVMADPDGGTFIDIPKLLIDRQYLNEKLKHVKDPTVIDFWKKEMPAGATSGKQGEILQWFVSKFGAFASNEIMRNVVGQVKSSFDLRQVMDEGKILIVNISKGRLGEMNSMLLGMIFVMKAQAAAMSRATIPENQRRDFTLYVDEFQNFSTDSFASILSEARKYHLSLIVANQYIAQLDEKVRDAVFGNAGTTISFRSSPEDADYLAKQFAPTFEARDIVNLPNFQTAVRLIVNGVPTQPFSLNLAPPLGAMNVKLSEALKQLSAAKYAKPKAEVENEIFKRLESKPAPNPLESMGLGPRPSQPERGALPARPAPPSKRSFLDEWLAKRRMEAASKKQAESSGQLPRDVASKPDAPTSEPKITTQGDSDVKGQNKVEPKISHHASKTVKEEPREHAKPEPKAESKPKPKTYPDAESEKKVGSYQVTKRHSKKPTQPPSPNQPFAGGSKPQDSAESRPTPKPGESVMPTGKLQPKTPQKAQEDLQAGGGAQSGKSKIQKFGTNAQTDKTPPASAGASEPKVKPKPDNTISDQNELDKKIDDLQLETQSKAKPPQFKPTGSNVTPPGEDKPKEDEKPSIPKLKPGEIYIDAKGNIHQAGEDNKDK